MPGALEEVAEQVNLGCLVSTLAVLPLRKPLYVAEKSGRASPCVMVKLVAVTVSGACVMVNVPST